jgi:predicted DNA-binding WGR domain protein/uncharacterized protein (UPF0147 family)
LKLIKTTKLVFAEGKTQRVYEVDLCEVGPRQFVVNFRYGKVGAALKDGSKTVAPVNEAEANKVFDKLVQQQIEKGYAPEGAPRPVPVVAPVQASAQRPRASGEPGEARQRARVLELLRTAARVKREPMLSRMIWRAGELRLREAEPILLDLISKRTNDMRDYCIAFALGRLGTSEATSDVLGRIFADRATPAHIRRMATLALQELSDEATRAEFAGHLAQSLPAQLQNVGNDPEAFAKRLDDYLAAAKPEAFSVVETLYMMNTSAGRPGVIAQLAKVDFDTPYWQTVRHIFKAAEYRRDARVFGLIAYRFEKVRAKFGSLNWSYRYQRNNQPPRAYGGRTRRYLRRRAWRTMRRAGELGDLDYVKLAVGTLLAFTDADAGEGQRGWNAYWSFNWILHAHNPEYRASPNGTMFRTLRDLRERVPRDSRGLRTRTPVPAREEAFPALWDQRPEGLMHLLAESHCRVVADFAAKIIRANQAFLNQLEDDDVLVLLSRPYASVAQLGFELAQKRYDRTNPNMSLLIGLAQCAYTPARTQAFTWLDEQRTRLIAETGPLAELVISGHLDTRDFARRVLRATPVPNAGHLIARVVALMLGLGNTTADDTRARDATLTLTSTMATHLSAIGQDVIRDLLAHPLSGVQELGAELLLRAGAASGTISDEAMVSILHSQHANVRAVGMRLLAEMPDVVLARMELLLVRLTTDKNADLRGASRPLVVRIARTFPSAGETIVRALIEALLRRKLPEDAPAHVLSVLREDLIDIVATLDVNDVWRLLQSQSPHAQELGGLLLQRMDANALAVDQIVKLASHDILSVRQAAWSSFERGVERVTNDIAEAARILDAKWEDSRAWARDFFRTKIGREAFTADVLVTILDSVREDVQAFGRELTTKYFREEDGPALMAKLAEHPSTAVQLYTTNYLARYAADAPGKLEAMMPYFTSVLSRVNRGRIAKQRVLAFLEQEGTKNAESAKAVISVLHRVSATMTIELRAAAIGSMMAIHHAQPSVPVPFKIKRPQLRVNA